MSPEARARKRKADRERKARQRAAMSPEARAQARRDHDANYRDVHREERRAYDRDRYPRRRKEVTS